MQLTQVLESLADPFFVVLDLTLDRPLAVVVAVAAIATAGVLALG